MRNRQQHLTAWGWQSVKALHLGDCLGFLVYRAHTLPVVREEDGKLHTRAELFIHTDQRAMSVYQAAKKLALREWSVGFLTPNEGDIQLRGDNEDIVRGDLLEVSIVMKGAGVSEMVSVREGEVVEDGVIEDDPVIVSMREKYNDDQRAEHVASGNALPDGSYAIADADDLTDAVYEHAQSGFYGSGGTAARAHIVARADALGLTDRLPSAWRTREDESEAVAPDAEVRERAIALLGNSAIRRALTV